MATPNPASTSTHLTPPKIPTGQEIFDAIMGHIEPELTTQGLETLEQKYVNETQEERDARKKRYALAFERYETAYEGYMGTLHAQVTRYRRESFGRAEMEDKQEDQSVLDRINQSFLSFA